MKTTGYLKRMKAEKQDDFEPYASVLLSEKPIGSGVYWLEVSMHGEDVAHLQFDKESLGELFLKHATGCRLWVREHPFGITKG